MNVNKTLISVEQWGATLHQMLNGPNQNEPIVNIFEDDDREFDAIFIGGGAAGRFGSAYLRALGGRQLIIDRWPFLGGSCPHNACVAHHVFSDVAAQLLLEKTFAGRLWFPGERNKIVSIKDIVDMFRNGRIGLHSVMNYQSKEQLDIEFVLNCEARIVDPHTVEAAGRRFSAKNLVLATGARPAPLKVSGGGAKGVFNYATLVESLDYEPGEVALVVGSGKTAIEYGCFFNATGRRTIILNRKPPMSMVDDSETRKYLVDRMEEQNIEFWPHSELHKLEVDSAGKICSAILKTPQGDTRVKTDFVFAALGQEANTDIAKQVLNIQFDECGFIKVNHKLQTSVNNVYAVGDLIGSPMEMFKARKSGMYAARNIMGQDMEYFFDDYPDFMHTHYEVSWFGLGEEEARVRYPNVVVIKMPSDNPNGIHIGLPASDRMMLYAMSEPHLSGFQKLVINGDTRKVLGAFHVGAGAKDGFQYLYQMVKRGLTVDELAEMDELFLNPTHFIQLCRLRSGCVELKDL